MKFVPNPESTKLFGRTPAMQAFLKVKAEAALQVAQDIAPEESGDYKEGLEVHEGTYGGMAAASLAGHDYKTLWIELGTSQRPAEAVLRRAVESVGVRLVPGEDH
jgi:hypothetical protein